MILEAIRCFII